MSQSNLPNAAGTASAIAAAATARQFQQLHTNAAAAVTDSLTAFDLIGGTQAAQQFINQIDLYAQQQRQRQQQQQQQQQQQHQQKQFEHLFNSSFTQNNHFNNHETNLRQQQHQQQHGYQNHPQSSLSSSSTSTSSTSSSTSPPSSNYNFQHLMAQNTQQQHQLQQQTSLPHLSKQHSITSSLLSLSSASASSLGKTSSSTTAATQQQQQELNALKISSSTSQSLPPSTITTTTAATTHQHHQLSSQSSPAILNSKHAALLASISNHNHQLNGQKSQITLNGILSTIQQHKNHNQQQQQHQQLYQMDAIDITKQQNCTNLANSTSNLSNALNTMPSAISRTSSMSSPPINLTGVNNNSSQQLQQQQHHHQHGTTGGSSYKSCWCFGETTYHMKILVPAVASGAIIGKGGETIASLQKDTGARVKMSKSHDFYPGTTERVCLITGAPDGIMSVLDFIMDKIREKPDLTTKIIESDSKQTQERDKQVKILVPNSTAGMIIGKGGAYIKQIKEESGSYVQISQKPKDISLQERCITIIGDKENNKNACKMILSKIVEDPQSGTVLNVSYADISGPVANFNPTGSPYATNQNAINSSTASLNSTLGTSIGGAATAAGLLVNGTGINLSLNLGAPNPAPNLAIATQILEHIKVAMRGSGYSETATNEVCAALGVLAKYGVLGMGVGVPHAANGTLGSYLGVSALEQQTAAANAAQAGNVFGAVGQVNLEQYAAAAAAAAASRPTQSQLDCAAAAAHFDPFRHLGAAQATTPVSLNNNSFGLTAATGSAGATNAQTLSAASLGGLSKSPTPGDLGAKDSKNVEIPEVIVGAILGPNGRSLVEIQHISGANVQISKKGIFAPGTRNRIVTITGQPGAIAKAQFLIEQKINDEESKRARQIPLTTVVN